jgi:hypothetical protein
MKHVSELVKSLNEYFGWNKARMTCFVMMLLSLFMTRTVNLQKLACVACGKALQSSCYRRLQRFFSQFEIDYDRLARFIFQLFFTASGQVYLTMDRTNWQWGKVNINILTLGIVFKGTAIPIYWRLLNKRGNSNTVERIELMQKFIDCFGKPVIRGLLADREFIGGEWLSWLQQHGVPFCIRVRNNLLTTNARGLEVDMDALFHGLKPQEERIIPGARKLIGCEVYLAGLRLDSGELLIVATNSPLSAPIKTYSFRWEIETLFGCLKRRGFNLEDTRLTQMHRIKKMFALLAIAFCWAHKTGEWLSQIKPIKIKKHGRPAVSIFRYGLDYIAQAITRISHSIKKFQYCIIIIQQPQRCNC